ncbi:MAG: tripartite tricarboxylate transporter substrate binding protein [Pseudomonadota bacterium]
MTTLHPRRRTVLGRLAAGAGAGMGWLAAASTCATAATVQTARLVLPLAPGGAMDALGRGLAQELGNRLGLSFIVENRAGAGGNIATEYVAGEKPDGRTLLLTSNAFVANTTLYEGRVHYDPVRSFAPVSIVATSPAVIVVRGDGAVPDLAALLRLARARGVTVGTPGIGNGNHLALVKMQRAVDGELRHIPYKGAGPAVIGLLGGEIDAAIVALPAVSAQLAAGKLRAVAVLQERRSPIAPQVPTLAQAGVHIALDEGWFGLLAPAATPLATVARLQKAVADAVADRHYRALLSQQGFEPVGSSTLAFASQIQTDVARFPPLLRDIGARID